jgi:hypothetical protein
MTFAFPTICTMLVAAAFLLLERLAPGRELPQAAGWYVRAVVINVAQAVITFGTNRLQGFVGWFVGTFFFYWWHRLQHIQGFWVIFHQVHHSPARIEAIAAFYNSPARDSGRQRTGRDHSVSDPRQHAGGRTLVQFFCRIRRAVLPFQHQNAAVGEIFHPDPGTPFDPSSA